MIYKVKMRKEDYFKINNKIISTNLEIVGDDVTFEIEGGSFNILKRTNYEYKLVESFKMKIMRFLSHYGLLLSGILFLISVLYMNAFRVSKITFNRKTPINAAIEYRLKSSFRTLFCFNFCNLDYDLFSKKMQQEYYDYPYIRITCKNNVINVYIAEMDELDYDVKERLVGDIVAKKDGIVDIYYVYDGISQVNKNKYVRQGDILISGDSSVSGVVMGTTYDRLTLNIPKREQVLNLTDIKEDYYELKLFSWKSQLGRDQTFKNYAYAEETVFNLFDFITLKKIAETKKNAIIKEYSSKEAYEVALAKIDEDFSTHRSNEMEKILATTLLKEEEDKDSYIFTFIIKKYESLGLYQAKE